MPTIAANLLPTSAFTEIFRRLNGYKDDELREWLFLPGMKFGDREKWWKPFTYRTSPHEGLDILTYLDKNGGVGQLPASTKIPPLLDGVVVGTAKDILGKTIILAHDFFDRDRRRLHTFYAHLQPVDLPTTSSITVWNLVGKIAPQKKRKSFCPPHLHLSMAWVDNSINMRNFDWNIFCVSDKFEPIDPLALLNKR